MSPTRITGCPKNKPIKATLAEELGFASNCLLADWQQPTGHKT